MIIRMIMSYFCMTKSIFSLAFLTGLGCDFYFSMWKISYANFTENPGKFNMKNGKNFQEEYILLGKVQYIQL